ncbi:MAG TPA: S41 family peptidase [Verrucomicrobiae bacterium]|nr:S41 family peptidase [Verrucomicrobiae bacterium]
MANILRINNLRRTILGAGLAAALAWPAAGRAAEAGNSPDFKEVYDLIRSHLAGESEAELDQAAVRGLLAQLHSKVALMNDGTGTNATATGPLVAKAALFDGPVAYLRIGRVGEGLAKQTAAAYKDLSGSTNSLKGIVLDLRNADGMDYAAAADTADLFVSKEMPLLDWGDGMTRAKQKSDAITLPVAVLVNQQTAGASEALAAILRETDRGLILGANTAGEATMAQDYPLKNGQRLRIATAAVKLGNGEILSVHGVKPDIQVAVSPQDEKAYLADPFKEISKPQTLLAGTIYAPATGTNGTAGTNRAGRGRISEADLIRERKEGKGLDDTEPTIRDLEVQKPAVRDPVLGRALDLIKGLSVIQQGH